MYQFPCEVPCLFSQLDTRRLEEIGYAYIAHLIGYFMYIFESGYIYRLFYFQFSSLKEIYGWASFALLLISSQCILHMVLIRSKRNMYDFSITLNIYDFSITLAKQLTFPTFLSQSTTIFIKIDIAKQYIERPMTIRYKDMTLSSFCLQSKNALNICSFFVVYFIFFEYFDVEFFYSLL